MSVEEDTFDIDIYGEDAQESVTQQNSNGDDQDSRPIETAYDDADEIDFGEEELPTQIDEGTSQAHDSNEAGVHPNEQPGQNNGSQPPQQGTKRKQEFDEGDLRDSAAPSDTRSERFASQAVEANATTAIKLAELNWWTTEEDLRAFCAQVEAEQDLRDLSFAEHKINGKSRGEAYMEFSSPQAASAVKREIENANQSEGSGGDKKAAFVVHFSSPFNPFKTGPGAGTNKKDYSQQNGRGGAYNQNYSHRGRGGFQPRGGGNFSNNNQNMYQNRQQQQQQQQPQAGWGAMGGGYANGGYGGAPMMGMNPMMGAGFNNMNQGAMMGNMMGRGNFNGLGNMGMGMGMNGSGMMNGMNMMGRGVWGGGGFQNNMPQSYGGPPFGGGGPQQQQQQQQSQAYKRMKSE